MKIVVAGATHLGQCLSIAAHHAGVNVLLFDTDNDRINNIKLGIVDRSEPGLHEFFSQSHEGYVISDDVSQLSQANLVVVAVDTSVDEEGNSDESEVVTLLRLVSRYIDEHTPVVVSSQVSPGFCRAMRETHSSLFYLMESLVFGDGINRAINPDRYVVGAANPSDPLPSELIAFLNLANCPINVMSYESAELAKQSANFLLASQIAAANSLASLAERVGADWNDIELALRQDPRIGRSAYIRAGPGIAGSNILRDVVSIRDQSVSNDVDWGFSTAILDVSKYSKYWTTSLLKDLVSAGLSNVALLGLAYKPGTESTRGGLGELIIEEFAETLKIVTHDPVVNLVERGDRSPVRASADVREALAQAEVVVIATPWPEYQQPLSEAMRAKRPILIIDPYRFLGKDQAVGTLAKLIQFGVAQ